MPSEFGQRNLYQWSKKNECKLILLNKCQAGGCMCPLRYWLILMVNIVVLVKCSLYHAVTALPRGSGIGLTYRITIC